MAYNPIIQPDHIFDPQYFDPVFRQVCCGWIPDLSRDWSVEYDPEGPSSITQSWIAPRHELLPLALRQMLSWNRDLYKLYFRLKDWEETSSSGLYFDRPLVPVSARLTPLPVSESPDFLSGHFFTDFSDKAANGAETCARCGRNIFPSIYTDTYRVDVQWARDEFTNRFGIKYAKVEIEPSIRLESVAGSSMGVVKIDAAGAPVLTGDAPVKEKLTTGFPAREPQVLIKVTFPWVSLKAAASLTSIINAGPIGNLPATVIAPGAVPSGQYLGTVNNDPFLGYPTGRVLYQSASLLEKVSPVTGRLGYQITHDFLCLATADWNMTRLKRGVETADVPGVIAGDQKTTAWPYGYIVAVDDTGAITIMPNGKPIYPYVYADLTKLFYYGGTSDAAPNDEA